MKTVRAFLIGIGIWYLFNLVLTWPSVYAAVLPMVYPGIDLQQGQPVFRLLLDAWLIVGIQLGAIGAVALWGARQPLRYLALIPVVVVTELVGGMWDIYSALYSNEAPAMAATTLFFHGLIFIAAYFAWRSGRRELAIAED